MSSEPTIMESLDGSVVKLWTVVYHNDPECQYTFFDWDAVLRSIGSAIVTFFDDLVADEAATGVCMIIKELNEQHYIPIKIRFNGTLFSADVFRWECDSHTRLHRVLTKCYNQVDNELKLEIIGLLADTTT